MKRFLFGMLSGVLTIVLLVEATSSLVINSASDVAQSAFFTLEQHKINSDVGKLVVFDAEYCYQKNKLLNKPEKQSYFILLFLNGLFKNEFSDSEQARYVAAMAQNRLMLYNKIEDKKIPSSPLCAQ
jgi:hypothetical protein